jgi:hypothetical protein
MPELSRERPSSPQQRYARLLTESVRLQQEYEAAGAEPSQNASSSADDSDAVNERLNTLLRDRVTLVRQIENPRTIEDAFPAVRGPTSAQVKVRSARAVAAAFESEAPDPGPPMTNDDIEKAWSGREWAAYNDACAALAQSHGYEVDVNRGVWSKDGLRFQPVLFALPSPRGIGGSSRVGRLYVYRGAKEVLDYDRGSWNRAPIDADTQQAIDRFVAVFG